MIGTNQHTVFFMKQVSILLHVLSIQIYGTNIDTQYNTYLGTNHHFFTKRWLKNITQNFAQLYNTD